MVIFQFRSSRSTRVAKKNEYRWRWLRSCLCLERLEARIAMSTFQVNTTLDTVAVDLRTGRDATGHVSLRSAIMAADAKGGSSAIKLPTGTFQLTIAGANEDASKTGDLDITSNLTITGAGAGKTTIDGNNLDRVFQVLRGKVSISGVTIEHGLADEGGGLLNSGGQVSLSSVVVTVNHARGADGANGSAGIDGGQQGGPGGSGGDGTIGLGGGIFNAAGSLSISNSTITGNQAQGGSGGQGGAGGLAEGASQPGGNGQQGQGGNGGKAGAGAAARGGGIYNAAHAILALSGSTISSNLVMAGHGGQGGFGGFGFGGAADSVATSPAKHGGDGGGGSGGDGGGGGAGEGGGLFNLGTMLLQGSINTFKLNIAAGGAGGQGGVGGNGVGSTGGPGVSEGLAGFGGNGVGGTGGGGGLAGDGSGGGVYNAPGGSFTSTAAIMILSNQANGGHGGKGGTAGSGMGGAGGIGDHDGMGGKGGAGVGIDSGRGSRGGAGNGGGMFNALGGTVVIRPRNNQTTTPTSMFFANEANGGAGGDGGQSGFGVGGAGGPSGIREFGGTGGEGQGGAGDSGDDGGAGSGGGLANFGSAFFTGITVDFRANQANSGAGGRGGAGGFGRGGAGGDGAGGGNGFDGDGGLGGDGGSRGNGMGGGIYTGSHASLTIDPRLGARRGTPQSRATDTITANQANRGLGNGGGAGGGASAGHGGDGDGDPGDADGSPGMAFPGMAGAVGVSGRGIGGGVAQAAGVNVSIGHTNITGNTASTRDNDLAGPTDF
jgi:hypothetical protein